MPHADARLPGPRGLRATVRAIRGLTSDPCPALDSAAAEFGGSFQVLGGPLGLVVIGDPTHLQQLLMSPNDAFKWGHWANVLGFVVGDTSIIVSDGDDHRRRRSQMLPAFARRRLDDWTPMIVEQTDRAIDLKILGVSGAFDFLPLGKDLVLEIVLRVLFGSGLSSRVEEIGEIFEHAQSYLELPALRQLPHPFPFTRRARVRDAHRRLNALIDDDMARRRRRHDGAATEDPTEGETNTDLLDVLMLGGSDALTDEEIRDQVNSLIGAGYNTTAASLAWTVLRAVSTPDVWQRLRVEADASLDADPAATQLQRLPYATAVVRESLRLHPAGVVSPRQAVRDIDVAQYRIRKGTMILWSAYLAGRDETAWSDPLVFDPDRHLDADASDATSMEMAWVPFGRGPRRCIGFALAQMELVLIVSRLAQRLDLSLCSPGIPRPYGMVVNRPLGGVNVTATARR